MADGPRPGLMLFIGYLLRFFSVYHGMAGDTIAEFVRKAVRGQVWI
jgi:hypothetical protein